MKKKKSVINPKPNQAGVMRNDLPGYMKVRGNKISVRYKGKDIATGFPNTKMGWQLANEWWAVRSKELQAIEIGEKAAEDSIENIFKKFLEFQKNIRKNTKRTLEFYELGFKAIFKETNIILNESSVKKAISQFARTTTLSNVTVNNYLRAVGTFLLWASDDDNQYLLRRKYIQKYRRQENIEVKESYNEIEYQQLIAYFERGEVPTSCPQNNKLLLYDKQRINPEMSLFAQFLWHTGARTGEALAIKLSDIDLEKNRILIANKVFKGKQEYLLLTNTATKIVASLVKLATDSNNSKLLHWNDRSKPAKIVRVAEKRLGFKLQGRGLHGFRRTFCDRLFENDMDIVEVQEIMRHKDIRTTIKHYKSIQQKKLLDKMNEKLE